MWSLCGYPNSGTDRPRAFSTKSPPFAHGALPLCLYLHPSSRSHCLPSRLRSAFYFVSYGHHCCSRRRICDLASGVLRHLFLPVEGRQACPGTRSWPAPLSRPPPPSQVRARRHSLPLESPSLSIPSIPPSLLPSCFFVSSSHSDQRSAHRLQRPSPQTKQASYQEWRTPPHSLHLYHTCSSQQLVLEHFSPLSVYLPIGHRIACFTHHTSYDLQRLPRPPTSLVVTLQAT